MNQKCQTIGHNQKNIEFVCIQAKEILWGCSKCFEQNKDKYNFKHISQIQNVLNQTIQEIKDNLYLEQIDNLQNRFNEALEQTNEFFIQSMNHLKQSFEIQYKEVLDFLKFFNSFSPDQLDAVSEENSKYLYFVVDQKATLFNKFKVQASSTIERLEEVKQEIKRNMNKNFDQGFQYLLEGLNYKYNIPNEFRQQIISLNIPQEYIVDDHPNLTCCEKNKLKEDVFYSGQLCNNQRQGVGILEIQNQNIIYYGAFIEGHFVYGIKCKLEQNQLFQGNFQYKNQFDYYIDNSGIMIKANLERYDGHFKNELPEGYGISHYKNQDYYCGNWKNGKYEGQGCLISEKFGQVEGMFKDGMLNGKADFLCAQMKYEKLYIIDMRVSIKIIQ